MKFLNAIVAFGTTLLLAVTLIAAGFAAVAVPDWATEALSRAYSGCDQPNTPFSQDELVNLAVAGKHYTFDDNNPLKLQSALEAANNSAEGAGRAKSTDRASITRTLDDDAKSHLDDVFKVVKVAKPVLVVIALITIGGLAHVGVRMKKRALGRVLACGGSIVIVTFAALGAWAAYDFLGMFNTLHSLFFSAGSWQFDIDSLLITMYPTAFWMGMGGIWLAVTAVLSILSIIIGLKLGKQKHGK